MDFANIAVDVVTCAYNRRCCSTNCIFELVKIITTAKVAEAINIARKNVYHTSANYAHSELRHLLKFGANAISEVYAYFDHMKALSSITDTLERMKVRNV